MFLIRKTFWLVWESHVKSAREKQKLWRHKTFLFLKSASCIVSKRYFFSCHMKNHFRPSFQTGLRPFFFFFFRDITRASHLCMGSRAFWGCNRRGTTTIWWRLVLQAGLIVLQRALSSTSLLHWLRDVVAWSGAQTVFCLVDALRSTSLGREKHGCLGPLWIMCHGHSLFLSRYPWQGIFSQEKKSKG